MKNFLIRICKRGHKLKKYGSMANLGNLWFSVGLKDETDKDWEKIVKRVEQRGAKLGLSVDGQKLQQEINAAIAGKKYTIDLSVAVKDNQVEAAIRNAYNRMNGIGATAADVRRSRIDTNYMRADAYSKAQSQLERSRKALADLREARLRDAEAARQQRAANDAFGKSVSRTGGIIGSLRNEIGNLYSVYTIQSFLGSLIQVGGEYQDYLLDVWDVVSSNPDVQAHSGQLFLELANEPVTCVGEDGQASPRALHDFFQPIVDKIRANGYTGVIWVPGSGWQANYRDYAAYPIEGYNIGYAVHAYVGWYDCSDETATPERFIENFGQSVPVVETNPILVTEVDWSPEVPGEGHYNEHDEWVPGNMGTWATGTTSGWGNSFKAMMDNRYGYFVLCLFVPFAEEVAFRGAVLRSLLGSFRNHWAAIAISAVLFAVVHGNPVQMPHTFLVGLLLGWMYYRTGSILPGVVLHWVNNTVVYVVYTLYPYMADASLQQIFGGNTNNMVLSVIFSMFILLPAIYQLNIWMKRADAPRIK